jgi:hypothetical protein
MKIKKPICKKKETATTKYPVLKKKSSSATKSKKK